jgi:hypothetical protein
MTDARRAEIRARLTATTGGPWRRGLAWNDLDGYDIAASGDLLVATVFVAAGVTPTERATAETDAEFLLHAKADMADVLDEVERLREALKTVKLRTVQRDLSRLAHTALYGTKKKGETHG